VRYFVGIDEAGRGALAGPVSVGAVLFPEDFDWRDAFSLVTPRGEPRLRDSKQLSAQQRDILYAYITQHGRLKHAVALVDAWVIDEIGIVNAAHEAAAIAISELGIRSSRVSVLLDAGLKVPTRWSQESFVRGDETIPAIAFASIIAKVTRDRYMEELAQSYEPYRFDQHKGYGTLEHRKAIRKEGLTIMHRTSFCSNLQGGKLARAA
jgi:ribonuclease HII